MRCVRHLSSRSAHGVACARSVFCSWWGGPGSILTTWKVLGNFVELEVVLNEGESTAHGIATAHAIMRRLGVRDDQLVDRAYMDLLSSRAGQI